MDIGTILGNAFREAVGPQAAWFALMAVGLNVHYGYTGLLNFGQIGFAMVGAYGVGVAAVTWSWPLWLAIIVGILAAALLALLLGIPTLRLRGDYFAIVTIAAAEILRLLIKSGPATDVTGGPFGLQNVAPAIADLNPFDRPITIFGTWTYFPQQFFTGLLTWAVVVVAVVLVFLLMRSPWGRILKAIREDEDAVRSLGKNVFGYKMQSLALGGVIAGLGGIMLTLQTSTVNDLAFVPRQTFFAYAILIIGGAATTWGPVIGSAIFWFLFTGLGSLLRQLDSTDSLPGFLAGGDRIGAVIFASVGLVLVLLMVYRPQGIFGDRRELMLDA